MASCSPGCPVSPSSEPGSQPPSSMLTGQGPVPIGFLEKGHEKYTDFNTDLQVSEETSRVRGRRCSITGKST